MTIEVQICEEQGVVALSIPQDEEDEEALMQEARNRIREKARKDRITNDDDMDDKTWNRYSVNIFDEIILVDD